MSRADDEWQAQVDYQGRVDEYNRQQTFRNTIASITGEEPTAEELSKYAPYIDNPGVLQSVLSRDMALRPARGTYKDDINAQLMSTLGREATPSELNYFGKQMEQGNLDTYGLQSFIKGTEEFQTGYTRKAREELKGELATTDEAYMAKVGKSLEAKYAGQGRPGAGAFGSALIGAGKDLASERGSYLAGIGYQGAQQGSDILKSQYQQNLNQMYQSQQNQQNLASQNVGRYYSQRDQATQLAGQQQLLALQNRYYQQGQPSFMEGLTPGLVQGGATIGAALIM